MATVSRRHVGRAPLTGRARSAASVGAVNPSGRPSASASAVVVTWRRRPTRRRARCGDSVANVAGQVESGQRGRRGQPVAPPGHPPTFGASSGTWPACLQIPCRILRVRYVDPQTRRPHHAHRPRHRGQDHERSRPRRRGRPRGSTRTSGRICMPGRGEVGRQARDEPWIDVGAEDRPGQLAGDERRTRLVRRRWRRRPSRRRARPCDPGRAAGCRRGGAASNRDDRSHAVGDPTGQSGRSGAHVGLGVVADAEREQLEHLAAVVLVDLRGRVGRAVEVDEHRRVDGHRAQQRAEVAQPEPPEQAQLVDHGPGDMHHTHASTRSGRARTSASTPRTAWASSPWSGARRRSPHGLGALVSGSKVRSSPSHGSGAGATPWPSGIDPPVQGPASPAAVEASSSPGARPNPTLRASQATAARSFIEGYLPRRACPHPRPRM